MNANLLVIVKQIVATHGEDILSDPQRVKAFFSDLAKDEPKPDRIAFGRCVEHGFAQILKNAAVTEREKCKQQLAQRLHDEEGLDLDLCVNAVDLLAAVLFGEQQKNICCKICGKELQKEWLACPYCKTVIQDTCSPSKETKTGIDKLNIDAPEMSEEAKFFNTPYIPFIISSEKSKELERQFKIYPFLFIFISMGIIFIIKYCSQ